MSDDNRRPEEIQADIERTRADLSETVDTIQHRVSPENLKNQVTHQASDAIDDIKAAVVGKIDEFMHGLGGGVENWGSSLTERVKENPVPAALIGVGISWLVMSSNKSSQRPLRNEMRYTPDQSQYAHRSGQGYTGAEGLQSIGRQESGGMGAMGQQAQRMGEEAKGRAQDWADDAKDRAQGTLEGARERAEGMADAARHSLEGVTDRAQDWAEGAQQGLHQAEEGLQRMMRENPLAVGAVALALGAAIGLAVPSTRQEDEFMGAARDQMIDRAKDVADRAKHVAQAVAEDVKESAMGEARREGVSPERAAAGAQGAMHDAHREVNKEVDKALDSARQAAGEAIDKGKDVVEKAADAAKRIAESAKETAKEEAKKQDL